jgi:guanyl-specific ribonuclease Sa
MHKHTLRARRNTTTTTTTTTTTNHQSAASSTSSASSVSSNKAKSKSNKSTDNMHQTVLEMGPGVSVHYGDDGIVLTSIVGEARDDDPNYYIAQFNDSALKNRGMLNREDRIVFLATQQMTSMEHKPLLNDLIHSYKSLLCKMIPDVTHKPKSQYEQIKVLPALDFQNGNIMLSKKLVDDCKNQSFMKCVKEVVNHRAAEEAEYVYGNARENCPFMFETIKMEKQLNERGVDTRQVLQIVDPNYFDSSLISITETFLHGIAMASKPKNKRDEIAAQALPAFPLKDAFANMARLLVDVDLNTYAEHHFLYRENFHQREVEALPHGDPLVRRDQLVDISQAVGINLINYPRDMPHNKPVKLLNEQLREFNNNKNRYSLADALMQMKHKQIHGETFTLNEQSEQAGSEAPSASQNADVPDEEEYIDPNEEEAAAAAADANVENELICEPINISYAPIPTPTPNENLQN